MHRTILAQQPLPKITPEDLHQLQEPNVVFVSVPRHYTAIVGPFEDLLVPLLEQYAVDVSTTTEDRIIMPCLELQFASIRRQIPEALQMPSKTLHGQAQSSLRTISLSESKTFHHDLKLALACRITSALRTITPWTALIGPEVSQILNDVLPPSMWVCDEIAAVTGSHADFDKAKHCSVLIRRNLEARARAQGQTLIVSAALSEKGADGGICHAERVFELRTEDQKEAWFRE